MENLTDILRQHRDKITVNLTLVVSCDTFWDDLIHSLYSNSTLETTLGPNNVTMDCVIRDTMRAFADVDSLEVVTKKGKILKRFARFYKETNGVEIPNNIQGIIGDKLQYHLQNSTTVRNEFTVDFTDSIDWTDGMFGKSGSCWWGTYADSIPTFESGGGWGIRFYDNMDDTRGIGRTWIMPQNNVLLCFNSYGIERPVVSKVIKAVYALHGITLHYKRVNISNSYSDTIPYINGDSGFVLYPHGMDESDILSDYDLSLEVEEDEEHTTCEGCNSRISYDESTNVGDYNYCESCRDRLFSFCDRCEEYCDTDDVHPIEHSRYDYVCRYCASRLDAVMCYGCDKYVMDAIETEDTGDNYCESCQDDLYHCESCDKYYADSTSCDCESDEEDEEDEEEETIERDEGERDFITCELERITYAIDHNDFRESVETVYRHERINGLYIRYDEQDGYTITHEESGYAIGSNIQNPAQAFELLNALGGLTDWTRDKDSVTRDNELLSSVRHAVNTIIN